MANTPKRLYSATLGVGETTVYTASSVTAIISDIHLCNTGGALVECDIKVNDKYIRETMEIQANTNPPHNTVHFSGTIMVLDTETVKITVDIDAVVDCTISGLEVT